MQWLARFSLRGPVSAALVAATSAVISVLVPPLLWLSGAVVGLVTLRLGGRAGLMVMAATLAGTALLLGLALGTPITALAMLPAEWLPTWLLALVLRRSGSLAYMLLTAALGGMILVAGFHLLLPEPTRWWYDVLEQMLGPALIQAGVGQQELPGLLGALAESMTGLVCTAWVIGLSLGMLMARGMQADLFNPGGLSRDFRALRLGRPATVIAGVLILGTLLNAGRMASDMWLVAMAVFLFQGFAVWHAMLPHTTTGRIWLGLIYVSLLMVPQYTVPLYAMLGLIDNVIDFRARLGSRSAGG